MTISRLRSLSPRAHGTVVGALALALLSSSGLALGAQVLHGGGAASAALSSKTVQVKTADPTTFRLTSFNLLGASHTAKGGDRKGWETGAVRMKYAVQLLNNNTIDLAGFQEMQKPQYRKFLRLETANFDIFPGDRFGNAAMANSIAWRRDTWTLLESRMIDVPYFRGNIIRKPLVRLGNLTTGQEIWVFNTHNPSNTHGPAQRWRDKAVRIEIGMVNGLREETPDVPVLFTGDMNDRAKFFCPITAATPLHAANGGSNVNGACTVPLPTKIDWILGTPEVSFSDYIALDDDFVNKTTDHPMVMATASIAPLDFQQAPIKRVVVLSVEGLRSNAIKQARATGAPAITRMISEGASTLNARTTTERTTTLPNVVSMLTGRRVNASRAGHGVAGTKNRSGTVQGASGKYVSSVFDLVHNFGLDTALFSSQPDLGLVRRSWDATNGGPDPYGEDNGRDKISRYVLTKQDGELIDDLTASLAAQPAAFSFVELSGLAATGRASGWQSHAFAAKVTEVDALVGRLMSTIESSPALAQSTLVILTADSGGKDRDHTKRTERRNYTVPFLVWGPGVAVGADLYALNPSLADPRRAQVGYHVAQPVRNGLVANLATDALGLPALPGSTMNRAQDFVVFADAAAAASK